MRKIFSYTGICVLFHFLLIASTISIINGIDSPHTDIQRISLGRKIDLFTQKGGRGYNISSSPFELNEDVILFANVTYNGGACWGYDVLFQIDDPSQNTYILYGRTNYTGIAKTSFHLSMHQPGVLGIWRLTASVNIAEIVVIDRTEFEVRWNLADINRDYTVDLKDVVIVANRFGCKVGDECYDISADITGLKYLVPDGKIDIIDIGVVAKRFGTTY